MGRNRVLIKLHSDSCDSDVAATSDLDLGPYIHAGVREIEGVWICHNTGAVTDHVYDCKFQEAATTVDSDFGDVTGGGFTQVAAGSENMFQLGFKTMKRYIRGYLTLNGTSADAYNFVGVIVVPRFDT